MYQIKDAVVARLDSLCKSHEISYNALANLAGVTPSTVYSVMDPHRREITINTIRLLCDGIGISLSEFFDSPEFIDMEEEKK